MIKKNYPILAAEGVIHMVIASVAAVVATYLWGWMSLPVWLLALFVFQFFRDPKRKITTEQGAIVAPASGKIVSVMEEENPYLENRRCLKVSIFMNVFSVHSNLIPIAGTIKACNYHAGRFFNAALDKASLENERNAIWIQTANGQDIVSVQIAGLIARRILCYVRSGDSVETGDRYGFIRFGSRVDLYMPTDVRLNVKLDQWVASGNDVIGYLSDPA